MRRIITFITENFRPDQFVFVDELQPDNHKSSNGMVSSWISCPSIQFFSFKVKGKTNDYQLRKLLKMLNAGIRYFLLSRLMECCSCILMTSHTLATSYQSARMYGHDDVSTTHLFALVDNGLQLW
ncbi:hypothetical protein BDR04DRAFT_1088025 [Suillus decipiens]|nr:hypothetical protein BDR04DRAFT_1088025 [Suillus decipiens]